MKTHPITAAALPFDTSALEAQCGPIRCAEAVCPGVYRIAAGSGGPGAFSAEYLVALEGSPALSARARACGTPLPAPQGAVLYALEDYCNPARHVAEYEIHRYLAAHGLPLPAGYDLAEQLARGREICPDYFGRFPVPAQTPWGAVLRWDCIWNGLFWLETAEAVRCLAIAYPLCDPLTERARACAMTAGRQDPWGYRFYRYELSCIPLFELMEYGAAPWRDRFRQAALKNAILEHFPDYAASDAARSPGRPQDARLLPTPGAGFGFYPFSEWQTAAG